MRVQVRRSVCVEVKEVQAAMLAAQQILDFMQMPIPQSLVVQSHSWGRYAISYACTAEYRFCGAKRLKLSQHHAEGSLQRADAIQPGTLQHCMSPASSVMKKAPEARSNVCTCMPAAGLWNWRRTPRMTAWLTWHPTICRWRRRMPLAHHTLHAEVRREQSDL